jgi:hypothetical protein
MYGWMDAYNVHIICHPALCFYLASYNFGNAHYNSYDISGTNREHNFIIKQRTVLKTTILKTDYATDVKKYNLHFSLLSLF